MTIFLGFLVTGLGTLVVFKSEWLFQNFGRIAFFEKYLGTEGGSRLGYKLLGIIAIFAGMLMMTGLGGGFMNFALSPLVPKQ